jgi:hypothetical protein
MATSLNPRRRARMLGLPLVAGLTFALVASAVAPTTATASAAATASASAAEAPTHRSIPTTVQNGQWTQAADRVYALASAAYDQQSAAHQPVQAFHVAALAWYAGLRFGWHDPRTATWLQRVYDREYATGGYGEDLTFDAFGDGTVNPTDTTYTITTAWHVGRMLLDGYDNHAVPRSKLVEAARSLLDTTQTSGNRCLSYSMSPYDENKPCVYNVTAAASLFLTELIKRGIWVPGRLIETVGKIYGWTKYLKQQYIPQLNGWTYADNNGWNLDDPGHLGPTSTAMYLLPGGQGYQAVNEYFYHYPTAVSTIDMLPFNCADVDTDYTVVANYLNGYNSTTPLATLVALGAYTPVALRVERLCGAHPHGLWADQAARHPDPGPVKITPWRSVLDAANNVGSSDPNTYRTGNFDTYGDSYDARQLPSPGTSVVFGGATFSWPNAPAGGRNNVTAGGQSFALSGSGGQLAFLGAATGAGTGSVKITYTDGSTSQATLTLPPWANVGRPSTAAIDTVGNYGRNGFVANGVHYDIHYASIPLTPGKSPKFVTLPSVPTMHIFALAVQQ